MDDVLQLQFVQQQLQGRAERNAPQVFGHRRFGIDAGVFEPGGIKLYFDVRGVLEILDDALQRRLDELDRREAAFSASAIFFSVGLGILRSIEPYFSLRRLLISFHHSESG